MLPKADEVPRDSHMLDRILDKSLLGYTSLGYEWRALDPIQEDLRGRTALVTGASSGLGKQSAAALAELGAAVILVGRNEAKTSSVASRIRAQTSNPRVYSEVADLSLMGEIRKLAERIDSPIHILVNNVGVLLPSRTETSEGLELSFATNLLGHFLLTNLLLPKLRASAPARIINVSSGGMYTQRIEVEDLQNRRGRYDGAKAYARSKRGQVILTELWAERLAGQGIVVHAMHPGWADTPGVSRSLPRFYRVSKKLLRSPAQGADTIVWLCAAEEPLKSSGQFWHDRKPRPCHRLSRTRETSEERAALWEALCRYSGWDGTPDLLSAREDGACPPKKGAGC